SLLNKKKSGALRDLPDNTFPGVPMRGIAMESKDPAVYDRVAAKPVSHAPTKGLTIAFPSESAAEELGSLVMTLIGAVDLRGDRNPIVAGGREVEFDGTPVLQPSIGVDP